jgi:hypothetical protein
MLAAQTLIGMLAMDCAHHSTRLTSPVFEKVLRGSEPALRGEETGEARAGCDGVDRRGSRPLAGPHSRSRPKGLRRVCHRYGLLCGCPPMVDASGRRVQALAIGPSGAERSDASPIAPSPARFLSTERRCKGGGLMLRRILSQEVTRLERVCDRRAEKLSTCELQDDKMAKGRAAAKVADGQRKLSAARKRLSMHRNGTVVGPSHRTLVEQAHEPLPEDVVRKHWRGAGSK